MQDHPGPSIVEAEDANEHPTVVLAPWNGPWPDSDPDANFKSDVALYSKLDPLSTIENLSRSIDVPVGSLCRYILAKWASAGAEALMTLGPTAITRMADSVASAEANGSDKAKLAAFDEIAQQVSWLAVPIDDPSVYPTESDASSP